MTKKKQVNKSIIDKAIEVAQSGSTVSILSKADPTSVNYMIKFKQQQIPEEVVRRIKMNTVRTTSGTVEISGIIGSDVCLVSRDLKDVYSDLQEKIGNNYKEMILY